MMTTKRMFRALMIAGVMIFSTAVVEAQRLNREALSKPHRGGGAGLAVTAQTPGLGSDVAEEAAAPEAGQGGSPGVAARRKAAVVGSWLDTVAVAGGPTFKSLSTYAADGSWVSSDQGSVITEPPFPHVFSAGHGVWVHLGGRAFSLTALQLISDLKGDLLFTNKIRQTVTLDASGDAYSAVWRSEFRDPAGNLVFSFEGTTEGRRIKPEPLP
jgi:hypothetical protein